MPDTSSTANPFRALAAAHRHLADQYDGLAEVFDRSAPPTRPTLVLVADAPDILAAATPTQLSRIAAYWPNPVSPAERDALVPGILEKVRDENRQAETEESGDDDGEDGEAPLFSEVVGAGAASRPPSPAAPPPPIRSRFRLPGDPAKASG